MSDARTWLSTLPTAILLTLAVCYGTGEALHSRLLQVGQSLWDDYASLRASPAEPECDPRPPDPEPEKAANSGSAGALEDDDFLDDLLGESDSAAASRESALAAAERCRAARAAYESQRARMTTGFSVFAALEGVTAGLLHVGTLYLRHGLVLLLLVGAATATARGGHVALRSAITRAESRCSEAAQWAANALLLASWYFKWRVDRQSAVEVQNASLPILWMVGFAVLVGLNSKRLAKPCVEASESKTTTLRALMAVPLYAIMTLVSGVYFFAIERHPSGQAIYLQKITEHSLLYVHVGLYVWAGMLLKRTQLAHRLFDLVRCWRLPPEPLAFVVVAASAIPTAYSGASGIFVIAAGATIYRELLEAGARPRLALAATAMSGSLGVVLSPCLLVVIVAALNKQVTTQQLFGWGWKVYALTAGLFLIATFAIRTQRWTHAPWNEAMPATARALRRLAPYLLVGAGVLGVYALALKTTLDEHTAPTMVPVLLFALLVYDCRKPETAGDPARTRREPAEEARGGAIAATFDATREAAHHVGALLLLMTLSVCLGGVIERSDLLGAVPRDFGSVWLTMAVLVVVLVVVGMIMDPYGAVILVSATVADVAYRSGIDPVQFWMVVLVAFELGYLSPPVALNHLLTRQVVGSLELDSEPRSTGLYARHEHLLLPLMVLSTALLLVAFVPLLWV